MLLKHSLLPASVLRLSLNLVRDTVTHHYTVEGAFQYQKHPIPIIFAAK